MLAGDYDYYHCVVPGHADATNKYYEGMSEAFARLARGTATVVHDNTDYKSPPMDGIYGRVELPTLQKWTDITEVSVAAAEDAHVATLKVPSQLWMTNKDETNSDRYSIQHSNRYERLAEKNMWRTSQLLEDPNLATRSVDPKIATQLVKRGGRSCSRPDWWESEVEHKYLG